MRILLYTALVLVATAVVRPVAVFAESELELVTYSDFSYVNYITTSMSHVYFATTQGIIRYDRVDMRWEEPLTGAEGIDHRDIQRIWVDMFDEKLFAMTSSGAYEYDLFFREWFSVMEIPRLNVNYIHIKSPETMFAPPGFTYDPSGYITDWHGRNFPFSDMIDDRSGNFWIGIWGLGVATAGSATYNIELLPFGLIQNRVNAIYDDDGVLWVSGSTLGAYRTGISIFNVDNNTFSHIESGTGDEFPQINIHCITGDRKYIYAGSDEGLFVLERSTQKVKRTLNFRRGLPDDNILALEKIGDSLFVGTESGLCLLTSETDSIQIVRPNQFGNMAIYDFEATDSTLWIASAAGGFQLHLGSGRLQRFQDPHNIAFGHVSNIEVFEDQVWLTSDAGLVNIDLGTGQTAPYVSTFRSFSKRALAANDQIVAVASDRGLLVYFLDYDPPLEREFTVQDGLPSENIYELLLDGDYLWIGSDRGLTRFLWNDPSRVD